MADDLRQRLIDARMRLGLSPKEMAEALMTPENTYRQWELEGGERSRRTPGVAVVAAELLHKRINRGARDWKAILTEAAESGEDRYDLAKRLGVAIGTITSQVAITGVQLNDGRTQAAPVKPSHRDWRKILEEAVKRGLNAQDVANQTGLSRSTIRYHANRLKIKLPTY